MKNYLNFVICGAATTLFISRHINVKTSICGLEKPQMGLPINSLFQIVFYHPCSQYQKIIVTSAQELKLTGNCIKGSRPILSFDGAFENELYLTLFKEIAVNTFSTPNFHPKSKPFVDHTFSFKYHDHKIWFRNYQVFFPFFSSINKFL